MKKQINPAAEKTARKPLRYHCVVPCVPKTERIRVRRRKMWSVFKTVNVPLSNDKPSVGKRFL